MLPKRRALYVSDLDGTLLRSDGRLSPYSVRTLTRLIREGMRFTVASARGCGQIRIALGGLRLPLPVVNQNGAFVSDLATGSHAAVHALSPAIASDLWSLLTDSGCSPFLITFDGGADRLYYNDGILRNDGMRRFLHHRQRSQDPRLTRLDDLSDGLDEQVVCLTVIDTLARVGNIHRQVITRHGDAVQVNSYDHYDSLWYWLTIHAAGATKDQALTKLMRLRNLTGRRLVVFGDQINDLGLFRLADEAYAVAGAAPELIRHATAVIGSHDEDAVARWLESRWCYVQPDRWAEIGRAGSPPDR